MKGGEADVEKAIYRGTAVRAVLGMGAVPIDHKSVLTARWHEQSA